MHLNQSSIIVKPYSIGETQTIEQPLKSKHFVTGSRKKLLAEPGKRLLRVFLEETETLQIRSYLFEN